MFSRWDAVLRLFLLRLTGEFSFWPAEIGSFIGLKLFSFYFPDLFAFKGLDMSCDFALRKGLFNGEVCIFLSDSSGLWLLKKLLVY